MTPKTTYCNSRIGIRSLLRVLLAYAGLCLQGTHGSRLIVVYRHGGTTEAQIPSKELKV